MTETGVKTYKNEGSHETKNNTIRNIEIIGARTTENLSDIKSDVKDIILIANFIYEHRHNIKSAKIPDTTQKNIAQVL